MQLLQMMLGFCSAQGGYSTSQRLFELSYNNQGFNMHRTVYYIRYFLTFSFAVAGSGNIYSDVENSFQANIGGSGFASTSQLFGSILMFIVALYLSPICFGSPNEFKAYAALHELEVCNHSTDLSGGCSYGHYEQIRVLKFHKLLLLLKQ